MFHRFHYWRTNKIKYSVLKNIQLKSVKNTAFKNSKSVSLMPVKFVGNYFRMFGESCIKIASILPLLVAEN